jgi:hypothetical protein
VILQNLEKVTYFHIFNRSCWFQLIHPGVPSELFAKKSHKIALLMTKRIIENAPCIRPSPVQKTGRNGCPTFDLRITIKMKLHC